MKNFIDYETFFYPLDAITDWNKIYGKSGFIQYQMVIPKETGKEGMKRILETIAKSGNGSFTAVLKLLERTIRRLTTHSLWKGIHWLLILKLIQN